MLQVLKESIILLALGAVLAGVGNNKFILDPPLELGKQYSFEVNRQKLAEDKASKVGNSPHQSLPSHSSAEPLSKPPLQHGESLVVDSEAQQETDPSSAGEAVEDELADTIQGFLLARIDQVDMVVAANEEGDHSMLLLDARSTDNYTDGHIPGALDLYYYDVATKFSANEEAIKAAELIIVYCNGGDCEDSLSLAYELQSTFEIENFKIWVYEGGVEDWVKHKGQDSLIKGESPR